MIGFISLKIIQFTERMRIIQRHAKFVMVACLVCFLLIYFQAARSSSSSLTPKLSTLQKLGGSITLSTQVTDTTNSFTTTNISHSITTSKNVRSTLEETVKVLKYDFFKVSKSGLTIISAYYNNRSSFHCPAIIIMGYQPKARWQNSAYCLIYYEDGSSECLNEPTEVEKGNTCNKYIHYTAYISVYQICKLPKSSSGNVPVFVSLSKQKDCSDKSGKLVVQNRKNNKERKQFGVCMQTPLYGQELKIKHIYEFIEIHRLLGVKMFTFYTQIKQKEFASSLQRVYNNIDITIELIDWPTSFKRTFPIHYYGELLSISDCLYRNQKTVEYLAFVDIDEVLTPLRDKTWNDLINNVPGNHNAYVFNNALMVQTNTVTDRKLVELKKELCSNVEVPKYLTTNKRYACTFVHPRRSKFILSPEKFPHIDIHGLCGGSDIYYVPDDVGLVYHYRMPTTDCKDKSWQNAAGLIKHEEELLLQMSKTFC